ncbi:MAG: 2-oxoacid:acceptor oxidoreductase family protein [Deltaproteobacteria bacterium]|nr:2-oxoacid:acceptor oxidoreductase family protein [Deltaproteobacteria bacterium]
MKDRIEVVASGFGGQGVVRLGQILGQAAVKQGLHVTMLKSHGTEMRGGYVRSQVVISEKTIDSPICETPDYLVALSSAAYDRFKDTVPPEGVILYDSGFVTAIDEMLSCRHREVPAKALSMKHFQRPIFANTIILGALARYMEKILDKHILLESVLDVIPKFHDQNKSAFDIGYNL